MLEGSRLGPTATSGSPDPIRPEIAMFNPSSGAISTFPLPSGVGPAQGITLGPDGNLWFAVTNSDQIGTLDPSDVGSAALPRSLGEFGFTLSARTRCAAADVTSDVTLSLAADPGGDTLTVSTKHGVAVYSGLTLNKEGGDYKLVASASIRDKARASGASVASLRPILSERVPHGGQGEEQARSRTRDRTQPAT